MKSPTISVIMSTYNHADFVAQAINSVLSQRDVDFEFLIADDGSVDGTREVVASIHDDKIRFLPNEVNRGACVVTNELIKQASGEFIALMNSDDYWINSNKLASQLHIMRNMPEVGACFGKACFVDKEGQPLDKSTMPNGHIFEQHNRSRSEWLKHFFDHGNCLCHPTMLIRKSCYDLLGAYDNRLRQLPDFDMWIRLLKHSDIHIMDEEMIAFRVLPGENASCGTNMRRIVNEFYVIMKNFFADIPLDIFIDGFGDLLIKNGVIDNNHFEIEKALLFYGENRWADNIYNLIYLEKLYTLLGSDCYREILFNSYGIDNHYFHRIAAECATFDILNPSSQDGQLAERDAQLAERDAQLAERDAQLLAITNSNSWLLTKPLRVCSRAVTGLLKSCQEKSRP